MVSSILNIIGLNLELKKERKLSRVFSIKKEKYLQLLNKIKTKIK
jgi:hypothetical protein